MLVIMLIVIVLIGVAYADFCLVSNTAHFGICYGKVAEAEKRRDLGQPVAVEDVEDVVPPAVFEATAAGEDRAIPGSLVRVDADAEANGTPARPPRVPAPAWLLLDLGPVLELHEPLAGARR
ncbi:MAG: hypothetical protein WBO43_11695 [Gemmatimonadota bacterium]